MAVTLSAENVSSKLLLLAVDSIEFKPPIAFNACGKFENLLITLFSLTPPQIAAIKYWKYFFLEFNNRELNAVVRYVSNKTDLVVFNVESSTGEIEEVFDVCLYSLPYVSKLGQSLRTAFQTKAVDGLRVDEYQFTALHCFLEKRNVDVVCSELRCVADRIVQSVAESFLRNSVVGMPMNVLVIGEKEDLMFMVTKFASAGYNSLFLNLYGEFGMMPTVSKAVMVDSPHMAFIEEKLQLDELRPLNDRLNVSDAEYFIEHCSLYADKLLDECSTLIPRVLFATPSTVSLYVPKLKSAIHNIIVLNGNAISDFELLAILSSSFLCKRLSIYTNTKQEIHEFPIFKNSYIKPQAVALWFAEG